MAVVVAVWVEVGGGLYGGGGGGSSPALGGRVEMNVPIGVGVGAKDSSVGVGDWTVRGVLITLGVEVGSFSGVSMSWATSLPGTSVGWADWGV